MEILTLKNVRAWPCIGLPGSWSVSALPVLLCCNESHTWEPSYQASGLRTMVPGLAEHLGQVTQLSLSFHICEMGYNSTNV